MYQRSLVKILKHNPFTITLIYNFVIKIHSSLLVIKIYYLKKIIEKYKL